MSTVPQVCRGFLESLVAFARTVSEEIANKQTDILLYIYRSYMCGIFRFFNTRHPMCSVYSFCSVPIIICVWHIQFVLYASSYVFRLFLSFFSSILKFLVPNGKKRKFQYTFVLELLRKQSRGQTLLKKYLLQ